MSKILKASILAAVILGAAPAIAGGPRSVDCKRTVGTKGGTQQCEQPVAGPLELAL